jgi:hypothetical protein
MVSTPRKRNPPPRNIDIVARQGEFFLLEISVGKHSGYYIGRAIPTDFGVGFALEKQSESGTAETYHVNICDLDGHHLCDCRGHGRWGHCKHSAGIAALVRAGKFTLVTSPEYRPIAY